MAVDKIFNEAVQEQPASEATINSIEGSLREIIQCCENSLNLVEAGQNKMNLLIARTLEKCYLDAYERINHFEKRLEICFGVLLPPVTETVTGETSEKASVGIAVTEEVKKEGEVTVETSEKASAVTEEVKKEGELTVETSEKASAVTEEVKKEGEVTVETSDKASAVTEEANKEGEVTGETSEKASAGIAMTEKMEKGE